MSENRRYVGKYMNISIPMELIKIIDKVLEEGKYGYRSRTEFITDSIRKNLRDLGYLK